MNDLSAAELDLELHFLPAWAKQAPATNRYASHPGEAEGRGERRGNRDFNRGPRRPGAPRREGAPDRNRRPEHEMESRREVPHRAEITPPAGLVASLTPGEEGVRSLARQIKLTGRAYPLFDIAYLILEKPARYHVTFQIIRQAESATVASLFHCNLDDTLWLTEDEAVRHVLGRHFQTFYQPEKTAAEPPKGVYTFVAQCGLSGAVLGPPNYHDYQTKLRRLHAERFGRMPFEAYKARVRIVKDEETVKKWVEEQSWKTEYACLNVPEPRRLGNREETERHFREVHLANHIKPVNTHTLTGVAAQQLSSPPLREAARRAWEEQMRFPMELAKVLSERFAGAGLHFFKAGKNHTHVSVARPKHLELESTPVSDGIRRIMDFITATPRCSRRQLLESLALAPADVAAPNPAADAVNADLHWLIHQGHVIEFANGLMEAAHKPQPRPLKPAAERKSNPGVTALVAEPVGTRSEALSQAETVNPPTSVLAAVIEPALPEQTLLPD